MLRDLASKQIFRSLANQLLNVAGYRLYRADRRKQSKLAHGGVAILAHESVNVAIIPTPVTDNQEQSSLGCVRQPENVIPRKFSDGKLLLVKCFRYVSLERKSSFGE